MSANFETDISPPDRRLDSVIGNIRQELKYYPTAGEFGVAMAGLTRLYAAEIRSPFAQSLLYHASLANAALQLVRRVEKTEEGNGPAFNYDFLYGEVLAMHVETSASPREVRQHILKTMLNFTIPDDDPTARGHVAERFISIMDNPTATAMNYFPDDLAYAVTDAALHYDGSEDGESRELFTAGYLHSTNMMSAVAKNKLFFPKDM